ncbi:MAG: hypothetical protein ACLQBX_04565 [Candidatus Limnocylindrales bacterium]
MIDGWRFEAVVEPARRAALRDLARREHAAAGGSLRVVRAPLRDRIVRIWVGAGGRVEGGRASLRARSREDREAMKIENEILATGAGTIEVVSVEQGDELVVIA